jgi:hypothetical protein
VEQSPSITATIRDDEPDQRSIRAYSVLPSLYAIISESQLSLPAYQKANYYPQHRSELDIDQSELLMGGSFKSGNAAYQKLVLTAGKSS